MSRIPLEDYHFYYTEEARRTCQHATIPRPFNHLPPQPWMNSCYGPSTVPSRELERAHAHQPPVRSGRPLQEAAGYAAVPEPILSEQQRNALMEARFRSLAQRREIDLSRTAGVRLPAQDQPHLGPLYKKKPNTPINGPSVAYEELPVPLVFVDPAKIIPPRHTYKCQSTRCEAQRPMKSDTLQYQFEKKDEDRTATSAGRPKQKTSRPGEMVAYLDLTDRIGRKKRTLLSGMGEPLSSIDPESSKKEGTQKPRDVVKKDDGADEKEYVVVSKEKLGDWEEVEADEDWEFLKE